MFFLSTSIELFIYEIEPYILYVFMFFFWWRQHSKRTLSPLASVIDLYLYMSHTEAEEGTWTLFQYPSCHGISQSLEVARLCVEMFVSLLN